MFRSQALDEFYWMVERREDQGPGPEVVIEGCEEIRSDFFEHFHANCVERIGCFLDFTPPFPEPSLHFDDVVGSDNRPTRNGGNDGHLFA